MVVTRREPWRRVVAVLSVGCLVVAGILLFHVSTFYRHSRSASRRLLQNQLALSPAASGQLAPKASLASGTAISDSSLACVSSRSPVSSSRADGRLLIPKLSLTAPVVQGDGSAQLAVAVGHIPASPWPGRSGSAVLAAHNVSWFSHIDQLSAGDKIYFETACRRYVFDVTSARVVSEGSPLHNSNRPTLVLETCYPLNALWFTSRRYLVTAQLSGVSNPTGVDSTSTQNYPTPAVSLPPSESQPSSLTPVPLGGLVVLGTNPAPWLQSLSPLRASSTLVTLYEAAMAAAANQDTSAMAELSLPGRPVAIPEPLAGATVTHYLHGLSPTITANSASVTSASTFSRIQLQGGPMPGTYGVTMSAVVSNGEWKLTALTATPN